MSEINLDHLRSLFTLLDLTVKLNDETHESHGSLSHSVTHIRYAIILTAGWERRAGMIGWSGYAPKGQVGGLLCGGESTAVGMIRKEYGL